jgi:hypothetical protein
LNGNNELSKINLKCTSYTRRIEFVYSDSQTFGFCYNCSTYVKNFTIDMINKQLFSLGYNTGAIIDSLEICVKDETTSAVTCMIGCDTTKPIIKRFYFTNYNIISFVGSFNSNYNSLAEFGVQYIEIN